MTQDLAAIGKRIDGALPALFAPDARTAERVLEFFAAQIRNPNTRKAYMRAAGAFAAWCAEHGISELGQVRPVYVAAYVEGLGKKVAAPSVKLQLAAIRMLFDWLVVGQVVPANPASSVRGPKSVGVGPSEVTVSMG
jgi:site-specific recombinase XerC